MTQACMQVIASSFTCSKKKRYTSMSAFPVLKDASGILVEAALLTVKDEKY